jgi:hypothetical protein
MLDFVKKIPPPSDSTLRSETVFEFDSSGKMIEQWWIPLDSVVSGMIGDELLIPIPIGNEDRPRAILAIRPRGRFEVVPFHERPQGTLIDCPKSGNLPPSDARWCWEIVDRRSGSVRRIAYDGPCT